jgi:hypothetical protein
LKVIWCVLSEDAIVDKATNKLSLFSVLEEITIISPPPRMPSVSGSEGSGLSIMFKLVTLWYRSEVSVPESGFGRISLITPEGKRREGGEFPIDLTEFLRLRHIVTISSVPLVGDGIYRFIIDGRKEAEEWSKMCEVPLRIVTQTPTG